MLGYHRENALFSTYIRNPISLTKDEGSRFWDDLGNENLDSMSGIATMQLGTKQK
ncbi:hypothetical protein J6TS1_18450 [Siminovitchia terrae]|uniref:Uncharacterized protein n=1 Tax=Siminovitchia terrae TaxID=1914933 RepID=A0ABQ4KVI1_SIMTE|nr:hypothetical protein J6TS1_18450 [Siminovitchia terrae]